MKACIWGLSIAAAIAAILSLSILGSALVWVFGRWAAQYMGWY